MLVTTDETSPAYLAEIDALGWTVMNHAALGTKEEYGAWYPSLVDNVVLSFGRGFVGTSGSTSEWSQSHVTHTNRLTHSLLVLLCVGAEQCRYSPPDASRTGTGVRPSWSIGWRERERRRAPELDT